MPGWYEAKVDGIRYGNALEREAWNGGGDENWLRTVVVCPDYDEEPNLRYIKINILINLIQTILSD